MDSWNGNIHRNGNNREDTIYHQPEDPENVRTSGFQLGYRHIQCFMAFLGIASAFCHRINLSVAIVSMTQKTNSNQDIPILPWDGPMRGTVLSSFFWGYIILHIPGGLLAQKFGPKLLLVTALSVSSVIMVLTPFVAIYGGFYWMIFSRVLTGLMQGLILPSVHSLLSKWVPKTETGILVNLVFCGADFGILVTMAMAGALADSRWGWPSVFYVSGGITMLWVLVFAYVGANSPCDHTTISGYEKAYIINRLPDNSWDRKGLKTPWKAIMSSPHLWALAFAWMAGNWGYYTLLTQIPSYYSSVFGVNIKRSGFLSALPYLLSLLSGWVFAAMNDWLYNKKILSRTALRKLWNTIAQWGEAIAFCLIAFAGESETLAMFLLTMAVALSSARHCSFFANHLDLAPNFAGTLMGITLGISTISSLSAPLFAGFIVTDTKSLLSWRIIFLTAAAILFTGNLIYLIFASAEVQPWNFPFKSQKLFLKNARILPDDILEGEKSKFTVKRESRISRTSEGQGSLNSTKL